MNYSEEQNGVSNDEKSSLSSDESSGNVTSVSQEQNKSNETTSSIDNCGGHRAGFDAFMTGFSFATFIVHSTLINPEPCEVKSRLLGVPIRPEFTDLNIVNRIYLVCKDIPFMVRKSAFCRNSIGHSEKYTMVNQNQK